MRKDHSISEPVSAARMLSWSKILGHAAVSSWIGSVPMGRSKHLKRDMLSRLLFAIAIAGLLLASVAPARADLDAAVSALESGAYETALRELQALADSGDMAAAYYLGFMFKDGLGVRQDPAAALAWFLCATQSDGEVGRNATGWARHISSSLDEAVVSAARKTARGCRAKAQAPTRSDAGADAESAGSDFQSDSGGLDIAPDKMMETLSRLELPALGGGGSSGPAADTTPSSTSTWSFLSVPKRRSVWSRAFFLPADGTIVGSQHVAWEFGARDLFRDLRSIANSGDDIGLGLFAALWWALIGKTLWSIGSVLMRVFWRSEMD